LNALRVFEFGKGSYAGLHVEKLMDGWIVAVAAADEGLGYALVRWTVAARSIEKERLKIAGCKALPKLVQFRDWPRRSGSEFPQPPV
jgi:hypothetical protein